MRAIVIAALLALVSATGRATAADSGAPAGRLPSGVRPVHYAITVEPDAAALTFRGHAAIDIRVDRPTTAVTLNAADLTIDSARLDGNTAAEVKLDEHAQTAAMTFAQPVAPGPHRLTFEYAGRIYTSAYGLFAVDYATQAGPRRMLTTQFEVGDARRFAPTWDEPAAKATFSLEVLVPTGLSAYSNMPVAETVLVDGKQRIRFATTPKMSSYLLHLTVGDLERTSRSVAGVDIGVVTRKGAAGSGRFALDAAAEILPWYNDYFGTRYPLPKLDMIAVPGASQFFGAMENWGAIMYFEPAVLLDPRLSSESDRQGVYYTVAHEMAHQWFGDLVTMDWWDDLWLNEGYATWMANKVMTALHPQWGVDLQFVNNSRERAMQLDAGTASHPVVQPVPSVDAANQVFDSIAYSKGSAVIRMLEAGLGEAGFRDGIRRYLRRYSYGNADTDQLWAELEAATGQPVTGIAHDFTLQTGVPLVTVATHPCESGKQRVELSQSRFENGPIQRAQGTWRIPVWLQSLDGGARVGAVLGKDGAPAAVDVAGCGPVVANAGQTGYFRVQYSAADLSRLQADFAKIPVVDRLGILNDTAALSDAGLIAPSRYLDLAAAVPAADDPQVLIQVANRFALLDRVLAESRQLPAWRSYARDRLRPVLDRIGWIPVAGEREAVAMLREKLITTLGRVDDPAVIATARRQFQQAKKAPDALPPAIYRPVLTVVAMHADDAAWKDILERARAAKEPIEKERLYSALGMTRDSSLAERALQLALTGEIPPTLVPVVIDAVSAEHPAAAFEFTLEHRQAVMKYLDASSWWSFIPSLAAASYDRGMIGKVQAYMNSSVPSDARQASGVAMDRIRFQAECRERQVPAIEAWLSRTVR